MTTTADQFNPKRQAQVVRPSLVIFCKECEREGNTPLRAAAIVGSELVVDKRPHHGRHHAFKIDLEYLKRLMVA